MMTRLKIATTVESISLVTSQRTAVNDCIQIALNRVYEYFDWPYYMVDNGVIETVADYNTGTIAIANGSQTGTITTGTVSTDFIYRKLRVGNDKPFYRITGVSIGANTITIDVPYQGTTVTASTYEIFQDEYRLASDVDKYKMMRQFQNGIPLLDLTPKKFDEMYPTPQSYADPIYNIMVGSSQIEYTTGTVSGSSHTITGVGTSWTSTPYLRNMGNMNLIRIGNNVYTIKSVDSDTQITVYDNVGTIAALSTYTILMNNLICQLYQIPNANRVIRYRYFRQPNPLMNDYDVPDMPYQYHHLLVWGALSEILSLKGDINKAFQVYEQRFLDGLNNMKMKIGSFAPDRSTRRRSVDATSRVRRLDGLEASHFDRRYSM